MAASVSKGMDSFATSLQMEGHAPTQSQVSSGRNVNGPTIEGMTATIDNIQSDISHLAKPGNLSEIFSMQAIDGSITASFDHLGDQFAFGLAKEGMLNTINTIGNIEMGQAVGLESNTNAGLQNNTSFKGVAKE